MTKKLTTTEFIRQANLVHDNKFMYPDEYVGSDTKIAIVCCRHGVFYQTPHNHISNCAKCPNCANEERSINYRKSSELFVLQAKDIHNSKYTYFDDYINTHKKIKIECPEHGIFYQMPVHHLHGHGCPKCGAGANVSKVETAWLDAMGVSQENRQTMLKIGSKRIKVDAFDPSTNTVYEFYGDYWHGNPHRFNANDINLANNKTFGELYRATIERETIIKQAGYNLISLWENRGIKL
jgi:hypothetical protein